MDKLTSDSDSDDLKTSKKHVFMKFPRGFGSAKFIGEMFGHVAAKLLSLRVLDRVENGINR